MPITADGWYTYAERVPGPADKVYSEPCTAERWLPHDAVGYLLGWYSRLFDLTKINGRYTDNAAASVTGIILDQIDPALTAARGGVPHAKAIQHYSIFKSCWASGSFLINTTSNAWEHERIRGNLSSLDMPAHMVNTSVLIARDLAAFRGWKPRRPVNHADLNATCYEHRECIRFGAAATSCPNTRADKIWAALFAPTPQALGDQPMNVHAVDLKWGTTPAGWEQKTYAPGVYRFNVRGDAGLPPGARMVRLHCRVRSPFVGSLSYAHGPGGFASLFDARRMIGEFDVMLADNGEAEFAVVGAPVKWEKLRCVGYW